MSSRIVPIRRGTAAQRAQGRQGGAPEARRGETNVPPYDDPSPVPPAPRRRRGAAAQRTQGIL